MCTVFIGYLPFRWEGLAQAIVLRPPAGIPEGTSLAHLGHYPPSPPAMAAVRGIQIEELVSELEGDIDLNGFLGLNAETPKGYTDIRAKFRVKARPEDIDRIKQLARFSPVFNTITRGANVEVDVELK